MIGRWKRGKARALVVSFVVVMAAVLEGCSGGGRVNEQLSNPETLRNSQQAVALFRLALPDPSCNSVAVSIGMREGPLYRSQQTLRLQQTSVTNVLEVLLAPGEYHVLGFACYRARSTLIMAEPQGNGLLRRSYANFSVAAGEVVNLGQIRLVRSGRSPGIFNSFVGANVEVSDWPLAELERFKSQRPKHYAEMRVRLMTVAPVAETTPEAIGQKCAEFARLQADGKIQNLPTACAIPAVKPKA